MLRRIKNSIVCILCLGGLGFIGQNFSYVPRSQLHGAPTETTGHSAKKVVRIDGHYFEYNPKNTYLVKGVPTFYVESRKSDGNQKILLPPDQIKIQDMVEKNALKAYTPQGMKAIVNEASRIRNEMDERNKYLQTFDQ